MKERYRWKAAIGAAFLFIFGGAPGAAQAQVAVSPVRIDLSDEHNKDVIHITNQEQTTKSFEVELVAWSQSDERREVYTPTDDVLAVPPLFSLGPGEEQIVRIGLMTDAASPVERSYRMFITELAPPQEEKIEGAGVNLRLRLGIPVFVAPTALPYATLDYFDSMQIEDQLFMHLRNAGNTHVKVSEVRYLAPGKDTPDVESAVIYILAGQTGYVPVALSDARRGGKVTLVTDALGNMEYDLSPAN